MLRWLWTLWGLQAVNVGYAWQGFDADDGNLLILEFGLQR